MLHCLQWTNQRMLFLRHCENIFSFRVIPVWFFKSIFLWKTLIWLNNKEDKQPLIIIYLFVKGGRCSLSVIKSHLWWYKFPWCMCVHGATFLNIMYMHLYAYTGVLYCLWIPCTIQKLTNPGNNVYLFIYITQITNDDVAKVPPRVIFIFVDVIKVQNVNNIR